MEDIKQLKRFQHFVWNIEKMLINLQVMMRKEKRNISVIPGQVSSGMLRDVSIVERPYIASLDDAVPEMGFLIPA